MNFRHVSTRQVIGLALVILAVLAASIRIFLPWHQVFSGDIINLTGIDAYFQMRIVDNLSVNFPHLLHFDPFLIYPGGMGLDDIHFFNWSLAGLIWIIGLGHPTQHLIDVIGVFYPAILAALVVFPVYFLGRTLFNRGAGIVAAALIAILPGEYMGRSILGFTDQHIAEVLLSTTALMFLVLAVKTAGDRGLSFNHLRQLDWPVIRLPIIYAILAGLFSGVYMLSWQGALLFLLIITIIFVVQFLVSFFRGRPTIHLVLTTFILFGVTFVIFLPFTSGLLYTTSVLVMVLIPLVFQALSLLVARLNIRKRWYPVLLAGVGILGLVVVYLLSPTLLANVLSRFGIFVPSGSSAVTTMEMQPFLTPTGSFSTAVAWGNFPFNFFLVPWWPIPGFALLALIVLAVIYIRKHGDQQSMVFILVWTIVMLMATLAQRRFAYYLAVNIALLTGYAAWLVIWYAGFRRIKQVEPAVEPPRKSKKKKSSRNELHHWTIYHVNVLLACLIVFFFMIFPNISKARNVAASAAFTPSAGWQQALTWLGENTPEPLGDQDAYYQLQQLTNGRYLYPDSVYAVLSWWDYGYWITRVAHRIPVANPSQAERPIKNVAQLLLSENYMYDDSIIRRITPGMTSASEEFNRYYYEVARTTYLLRWLKPEYAILDYAMATTKFWAIVNWNQEDLSKYTDTYLLENEGQLQPISLYYPAYYRTLLVRLYNFGGLAVTSEAPIVVRYSEVKSTSGTVYRKIEDAVDFSSFAEAEAFVKASDEPNLVIVGATPFSSPIPLPAVSQYQLIFSSDAKVSAPNTEGVHEVSIFEKTPVLP